VDLAGFEVTQTSVECINIYKSSAIGLGYISYFDYTCKKCK
jgi:hypothetical protein